MKINIENKFFDESARTATYAEISELSVTPDGSSARLDLTFGDVDGKLCGRKTLDFTADEIKNFNNVDFANFGLIDYAFNKLGIVRKP